MLQTDMSEQILCSGLFSFQIHLFNCIKIILHYLINSTLYIKI